MNMEEIRSICKALPAVTEDIKWENDLVFCVGSKMFFVAGISQSPVSASFKVTDETFDEMCDRVGFKPVPYLARFKWVWIDDIAKMSRTECEKYIRQSYTLVKQKLQLKIKKQLGRE